MSRVVLDASAILAFLRGEPGADVVSGYRGNAIASAVNVAEAGARLADFGASAPQVRRAMALMGMDIVPFDAEQAYETTEFRGGDAKPGTVARRPRLSPIGGPPQVAGADRRSGLGGDRRRGRGAAHSRCVARPGRIIEFHPGTARTGPARRRPGS